MEADLREKVEDIVARWEETLVEQDIFELKRRRTDVQVRLVNPVWIPVYFVHSGGTAVRVPAWEPEDES